MQKLPIGEQSFRNLLGIAFDPTNRNIADWQMEQVV